MSDEESGRGGRGLFRGGPVGQLVTRIKDLEADVAELREQNLRLAEIADVLQELLVPLASRDQDRIDAAIAEFNKAL